MRGQAVAQGAGWAAGRASPVRGGAVAGVGRRPCAASACMERHMPLPTARPTSPAMVAVSSGPLSKRLHWRPEGVCKLDGTAARRCNNQGAQCMLPAQFSLTRAACCPFPRLLPLLPPLPTSHRAQPTRDRLQHRRQPHMAAPHGLSSPQGAAAGGGPPCCLRTVIDVPECHTAYPASPLLQGPWHRARAARPALPHPWPHSAGLSQGLWHAAGALGPRGYVAAPPLPPPPSPSPFATPAASWCKLRARVGMSRSAGGDPLAAVRRAR